MRFSAHGTAALIPLLVLTLPCHASQWAALGNAGGATDEVMIDVDSIEKQANYRTANIMILSGAPRENANPLTLDRRVQKTGFDCASRTFALIQAFGYLGSRRVGASPENADWKSQMHAIGDDPMEKRAFLIVCGTDPNDPARRKPGGGSGSGIIVDAQGDILTADHVIEHCKSITVKNAGSAALEARVAAVDPENDLAIITIADGTSLGEPARFRATSQPARLGETIGVMGYPLSGFPSFEPKATFGQVNSVAGVDSDDTLLQFSAPAQPGNSGGPVLDEAGQVIGVVVGEAPLALIAATGTVLQNVNLAVRGEVAQIFLAARGLKIATGSPQRKLSTEAIAAQGLKSTVFVQCLLQ